MDVNRVFLVVFMFECFNQLASAWKCPFGNVYIETSKGHICKPCKECPPGYEGKLGCNNFFPYNEIQFNGDECAPCKVGSFKAYTTGSCRECRPLCDVTHEIESQQCHPTHNRFCSCKKGHYRHVITGRCHIPDKSSMFYYANKPVVKKSRRYSQ